MIDSCSPRKLDPGLEQTYSIPSDLITSTMKSEPERDSVRTSSFAGVPISASGGIGAGGAFRAWSCCAREDAGFVANTVAPTAALFRNARRSIGPLGKLFFDFRTTAPPLPLPFISQAGKVSMQLGHVFNCVFETEKVKKEE